MNLLTSKYCFSFLNIHIAKLGYFDKEEALTYSDFIIWCFLWRPMPAKNRTLYSKSYFLFWCLYFVFHFQHYILYIVVYQFDIQYLTFDLLLTLWCKISFRSDMQVFSYSTCKFLYSTSNLNRNPTKVRHRRLNDCLLPHLPLPENKAQKAIRGVDLGAEDHPTKFGFCTSYTCFFNMAERE